MRLEPTSTAAWRLLASRAGIVCVFVAGLWPEVSQAGIPECGNIRLVEAKNCELRANIDCMAGCSELGIYKTACATKLQRVCNNECTFKAEPTCQDSCTVKCSADCDAGVNVICIHNCFGECVGSCDAQCAGGTNPAQCRASCEANCDGTCDIKCKPVVSGSCYTHCVECCGGSCTAQANMDCQEVCQDKTFEDCEHEFRANCSASCSVDGAIFCDGKYVISGKDIQPCITALVNSGQLMVEGEAMGMVTLGGDGGGVSCAFASQNRRSEVPWIAGLVGLLAALSMRRRRRP